MALKNTNKAGYIWGITRISLGFVFLWAFLDKLIGLGFATCRSAATKTVDVMCQSAWLEGGSPTSGFLKGATKGPFAEFFQGLAGNTFVDWLFMVGLLGIGVALILGIGMKIASYSGALMMLLMYLAVLQPANNPIIDDHIIYAIVLIGLAKVNDDQKLGLGKKWRSTKLVKSCPILE